MQWRLLAIALCACALVNCGGGGGGGGGSAPSGNPSPRAPVTISGTVAAGAPLAGMTVDVGHNIGSVTSTTTDAQGRYRVTLPDFALPPFIVTAYSLDPAGDLKVIGPEATYRRMHSISISGGTVNVTPFTTLQTVRLFGRKPLHLGDWTFLSELPPITEQRIATARDEVVAYLLTRPDKQDGNATSPVDVSGVANFISTPFTPEPGDPYDDALERFRDSLTPRETILGIEEHMLHAGDAAADLAGLFSLEFEANCFASPESAQAVMPHGRVPIRFGPSGITIGSYHHAIEPGDRLVLTTGWGGADDRWDFDLAITTAPNGVPVWREGIFVTQERGNIETISLGISGVGASNCSTLFLAKAGVDRKHPSIFSQIGLLANSLKDRAFVCPA
jgi:hypothetical protein